MRGFAALHVLAALSAALLTAAPSRAAPPRAGEGQRDAAVEYDVSLAGIPIGKGRLAVRLDGARYEATLKAALEGLAGVLLGGDGTATARGRLDPEQPLPGSFELDARYSGVPLRERMALDAGIVRSVEITPKPEPRPDRVPVSPADRTGVVDPLSALLAPVAGAPSAAACDRTVPVYDGTMRFDVVLSRGEVVSVGDGPYRGLAVDCRVRYVPVSGHRAGRKASQAMAANEGMSVRLAPLGERGPLLPLRISVDTGWGTAVVQATSWSVSEGPPRRPSRR